MDSTQCKIAGSYLIAAQSAAERTAGTLEKVARLFRDLRYAIDGNNIEKQREVAVEIAEQSVVVTRQLSVFAQSTAAWNGCATDFWGEQETMFIQGKIDQMFERIQSSATAAASAAGKMGFI